MNESDLAMIDGTVRPAQESARISVRHLDFFYGETRALTDISLEIPNSEVTAIIGPSGCGKSTLLRIFNRIYDAHVGQRAQGEVLLDGENILERGYSINRLRRKVGMVFQRPTPFPMSIYENIAFALRHHQRISRSELDGRVEAALRSAALWDEVGDRLQQSAHSLSGGQQQRLCIARAIAVQPEVILMDEPTSALDPISTVRIEDLISELKQTYTIVIVTHNMQQAARVSDVTAYMYLGKLIEAGRTGKMFLNPDKQETADYITGRFG